MVQMSTLPNFTYKFNKIPIKIPASCCFRDLHTDSKVYIQNTQLSQHSTEGEER
jgi:hypothetical protein